MAAAVQTDARYAGMDPEAGFALIAPTTDWAEAAARREVRDQAIERLRTDREFKGL